MQKSPPEPYHVPKEESLEKIFNTAQIRATKTQLYKKETDKNV